MSSWWADLLISVLIVVGVGLPSFPFFRWVGRKYTIWKGKHGKR